MSTRSLIAKYKRQVEDEQTNTASVWMKFNLAILFLYCLCDIADAIRSLRKSD